MFKYVLTTLAFVGLFLFPNLSNSHREKYVQWDKCHRVPKDGSYHCHSPDTTITFESQRSGYYKIKEVLDGDTLDLIYGDKIMKVRLYGIDTPETDAKGGKLKKDAKAILEKRGITEGDKDYKKALADEKADQLQLGDDAKNYVKDTLQDKDVFFLFDTIKVFPFVAQGSYNRILTYVFYEEDGVTHFLNIDLIVKKHAHVDYLRDPFKYRWTFIEEDPLRIQKLFAEHPLPEMNASNIRPIEKDGLTGIWEKLKPQ